MPHAGHNSRPSNPTEAEQLPVRTAGCRKILGSSVSLASLVFFPGRPKSESEAPGLPEVLADFALNLGAKTGEKMRKADLCVP